MRQIVSLSPFFLGIMMVTISCSPAEELSERAPATGPLRVHPSNPNYFADGDGRTVYLTGSHTWANLVERGYEGITPDFDYDTYLDFLQSFNHNFMRMWAWEHAAWMQFTDRRIRYTPLPYERTGPGTALDGGLKFDLNRFNQTYFDRLRSRVIAAGDRGIYVAVMLFQGFSIEQKGTSGVDSSKGNPWDGHPFNRNNNINGINGDLNGNGEGEEVHTLSMPSITSLQERYVRKVIDTINDLDNVLYEIANESTAHSAAWQRHMIDIVHSYEADKPKRHPVLYSAAWGKADNPWTSQAEGIAKGWKDDPQANDGRKVVFNDTDHAWGIGGNQKWVWKSFLRGLHPIFMDPYKDARFYPTGRSPCSGWKNKIPLCESAKTFLTSISWLSPRIPDPRWDPIRRNMGYTLTYANKVNLAAMVPRNDLATTKYCLANPGSEYLVYLPSGGSVTVDLSSAGRTLDVEWFNPSTGETRNGGKISGGSQQNFIAPFSGDAVLYIAALRDHQSVEVVSSTR